MDDDEAQTAMFYRAAYALALLEREATEEHMGWSPRDLERARRRLKIRPAADPEEDTEEQAIIREAFEDAREGRRPRW